jgi:hypothetical protein
MPLPQSRQRRGNNIMKLTKPMLRNLIKEMLTEAEPITGAGRGAGPAFADDFARLMAKTKRDLEGGPSVSEMVDQALNGFRRAHDAFTSEEELAEFENLFIERLSMAIATARKHRRTKGK